MPLIHRPIHRLYSPVAENDDVPDWYNHFTAKASPEDLAQLCGLFQIILQSSPFLADCLAKEVSFLEDAFASGFDSALDAQLRPSTGYATEAEVMQELRIKKRRLALLVGIADLAGWWPLEQFTGTLSQFAAYAIDECCRFLLEKAIAAGQLHPLTPENPAAGLTVLGMGKLGAFELNYSSDIDLILLFDPARSLYCGNRSEQEFFTRLARDLVRLLQERTADGYVFRTDLRLRPDPSSTPLALSINAAESYYESVGQNWERAAMIKARPVAGDLKVGEEFLHRLRPFIWRKHLDFAAMQDIHSIKRQIHAVKGHREIHIAGHDIKLGRGGIREIEFFAQTQQLIWGGRIPDLRVNGTCRALAALAEKGVINQEAAAALTIAYKELRHIEHRLQMQEDRQTHKLPTGERELEILARFSGFLNQEEFSRHLIQVMGVVEDHYADLFEEAPALSEKGNLVFTGTDDDPETLTTLKEFGFSEPKIVAATIRAWHAGRYRAMRSARARELLTELIPGLLRSLGKTGNSDYAFHRFDAFLEQLPAGVQILSLLRANTHLLDLFADCLGNAPLLAERLSKNPHLMEALLGLNRVALEPEALTKDLERQLDHSSHAEDKLRLFQSWSQELQFQAAYKFLQGNIKAHEFGRALSHIAEEILCALANLVSEEFRLAHGHFPGRGMAILALGRLGSQEMTVTSDLDLIFLYDLPKGAELSDGTKPLSPMQYYGRLSQRIIGALSSTGLYQVDMRLRPSGNNGPIASALEPFMHYQLNEAWTWEHMALTRARCVYGHPKMAEEINHALYTILSKPRDREKIRQDIAEMRDLVARQFPPTKKWDIKHRYGGDMDLSFLVQFRQLSGGVQPSRLAYMEILAQEFPALLPAFDFWLKLQQYARLLMPAGEGGTHPEAAARLARLMGYTNFVQLEEHMEEIAEAVYKRFEKEIGAYGDKNGAENRR